MNMFCFQCQETSEGKGCTFGGHCGKSEETANLQDLLIYVLKGLALVLRARRAQGAVIPEASARLIFRALFTTITNTNFDSERFVTLVTEVLEEKKQHWEALPKNVRQELPAMAQYQESQPDKLLAKAYTVGVLLTPDRDVRSLRETITYALKGIAAYAHHAAILGAYDSAVADFIVDALSAVAQETDTDVLFECALGAGKANLQAMALLDQTHANVFGTPELCKVPLSVRTRPAILVSGHDLKDMVELLEQTEGTGVDVYTHGEMISAHYYPSLRRFPHLVGNYGSSWWVQDVEFAQFNGPILMTSNCIVPVLDSYKNRIFTTGVAGYPGVHHLTAKKPNGQHDFSALISLAQSLQPPTPIEQGTIAGGFNHSPLIASTERILDLVARGKIKRFVVMGGCDGRDKTRIYYKDLALALPQDTVILTAGCAKYVFAKLPLGDIEGLPRVMDAGQCNDCYSLVYFAIKLKERLGLKDINDLPISYQVCWYDQKAVAVFLTLLHLGVKRVWLGPSLPAFLSESLIRRIQNDYQMRSITTAAQDLPAVMGLD